MKGAVEMVVPRSSVTRFEAAADAIVGGDLETVERLLREEPADSYAIASRTSGDIDLAPPGENLVVACVMNGCPDAARLSSSNC